MVDKNKNILYGIDFNLDPISIISLLIWILLFYNIFILIPKYISKKISLKNLLLHFGLIFLIYILLGIYIIFAWLHSDTW